jgi:hypothetical protein
MFLRYFLALCALLSSSANAVDWFELDVILSSPVKPTSVEAWYEQCVRPFDAATGGLGATNFLLLEQESGLCMDVVSCAFESCRGIAADVYGLPTATAYMSSQVVEGPVLTDQNFIDAGNDNSELPEAVVHPEHPGDVANSIKHAAKIGMGLSVKTSGHSFIGASTKKGTLNLNLSKLKKYALPETLSDGVFECPVADSDPESAIAAACKLAIARGKSAVMRGGGGQICDEAFRTLETWNSDPNNRPYHAMIGAAGTVGLAGWTFGGGLGGTTSMRSYGVGVDQVLHIEMVLPDGRFVRFGPSAWKPPKDGNQLYPQTTDVTGFCNEG